MRPATRLFTAFSILMLVCIAVLAWVHVKNLRTTWPKEQASRCATLCSHLKRHSQQNGCYPCALHDLVDGGVMTEKEYEALKFQSGPWSGRMDWRYHAPRNVREVVLFSGKPVATNRGGDASYVFGFADGATLVVAEKHLVWHINRTGAEWIRQ